MIEEKIKETQYKGKTILSQKILNEWICYIRNEEGLLVERIIVGGGESENNVLDFIKFKIDQC